MNSNIKKIFIILFTLAICAVLIFKAETKLNKIREEKKLVETSIVHNAPPMIAFTTIALGGFRGIIADILWLRTILLQSQGKYFEMVQLASWISKLQPGFTGTTTFLAWNMAYNISITYANPKDKWRWVQNAIKILKDAITDTPNKPDLYAETAWLYLHKIGTFLDSSNLYYKNQIVEDMYKAVGTWKPDWKLLANAPKNKNELLAILQKYFKISDIYKSSGITEEQLLSYFEENHQLPAEIILKFKNNQQATSLTEAYIKNKLLFANFMITPEKILKTEKAFGKLNWFLWQSHALYWLYNSPQDSLINNKKFISFLFMGLNQTLTNGNLLLYDKNDDNILFTGPNLQFIKNTQKTLFKFTLKTKYSEIYNRRYKNFMNSSILYLFIFGQKDKAEYYKQLLRKQFPEDKIYTLNLEQFIEKTISDKFDLSSHEVALSEITNLIKFSFIYQYENKNAEASSILNFAKILYAAYNFNNNKKLPPFQQLENSLNVEQIKKFIITNN